MEHRTVPALSAEMANSLVTDIAALVDNLPGDEAVAKERAQPSEMWRCYLLGMYTERLASIARLIRITREVAS